MGAPYKRSTQSYSFSLEINKEYKRFITPLAGLEEDDFVIIMMPVDSLDEANQILKDKQITQKLDRAAADEKVAAEICTTMEMAELFGVTDRNIRQLVSAQVVTRLSAGKYNKDDSIKKYIDHLKRQIQNVNAVDEQKRNMMLKNQRQELALEQELGNLVSRDVVHAEYSNRVHNTRAALLTLADKCGVELNLDKEDIETVRGFVREALSNLAEDKVTAPAPAKKKAAKKKTVKKKSTKKKAAKKKTARKKTATRKVKR